MMPSEIKNTVARLRTHRGTLLVVVIGIAALAFMADDARNQRLRAGISDDCAHAQYAMQMYPMTRCFTLDDLVNRHRSDSSPTPTANDERYGRSDDRSDEDSSVYKGTAAAERPTAPDYLYNLIRGYEGNDPQDRPR